MSFPSFPSGSLPRCFGRQTQPPATNPVNSIFRASRCLLLGAALLAPVTHATTATGLSSFDAVEEPSVKYYPATARFVPDDLVNITDEGGGTFRMFERYNAEWWDGDRDTHNTDRQRAEVKGLGPHQKNGDTFEYATTWRGSPGFRGSGGFCHIFQLKGINGDDGAPLVTLSIQGGTDFATVEVNRAGPKIIARKFTWQPHTWQTVRIRVKTSPHADGEIMVSVDGDAFQGRTGVEISRPDATEYRPKWGLYRRAAVHAPMGDDYVEHKDLTAQKAGAPIIDNAPLELAARQIAKTSSPAKSLAWLQAQPTTTGRDYAIGTLAAFWAESDAPAAMAWAESQPAGVVRLDATARIFCRWADRDVPAATKWLHARTPDPQLDPLLWLFTTDTTYRYVNRPVALDALPLISDPALRAAAFDHVTLIWARQFPDDAAKFVAGTAALSVPQKDAIIAKIRRPRGKG